MRKIAALVLCLALLLAGCGVTETTDYSSQTGKEITVSFDFGDRAGIYIGEYDENGFPHGYGVLTSERTDGTKWTYSGQWEHGHWNGYGSTVWEDGQIYAGEYSNDYVSGSGMYNLSGGEYAIGECDDSGLNGVGMHITTTGETIIGEYVDGVPTGWCAMYLAGVYDGYVFWGCFEDGESRGVCYTPSGDCVYAEYVQGKLIVTSNRVDDSKEKVEEETPPVDTVETETPETAPEESIPEETKQQITTGMRNAANRARKYLQFTAFSYSGLINQLKFEGYTDEEATYGADNCGADWNEQAVKKAKQYLDFSDFSKSGLISQLEFEGFTHEQAVYGAEQNGY